VIRRTPGSFFLLCVAGSLALIWLWGRFYKERIVNLNGLVTEQASRLRQYELRAPADVFAAFLRIKKVEMIPPPPPNTNSQFRIVAVVNGSRYLYPTGRFLWITGRSESEDAFPIVSRSTDFQVTFECVFSNSLPAYPQSSPSKSKPEIYEFKQFPVKASDTIRVNPYYSKWATQGQVVNIEYEMSNH